MTTFEVETTDVPMMNQPASRMHRKSKHMSHSHSHKDSKQKIPSNKNSSKDALQQKNSSKTLNEVDTYLSSEKYLAVS